MKTILLTIYGLFVIIPLGIAIHLLYFAIKFVFVVLRVMYELFIWLPWRDSGKTCDSIIVNVEAHMKSLSEGLKK